MKYLKVAGLDKDGVLLKFFCELNGESVKK